MLKNKKFRRIGILTGGGDCPGLNAVIRAVTKTAIFEYGYEVFGIEDGYAGLIEKRGFYLTSEIVSGILTHGGTILGTSNRSNPFRIPRSYGKRIIFKDESKRALHHYKEWGLDALVVVGGDGTLTIAKRLGDLGIPVVGIPKTIDNDISGTDFSFGFHTAVTIATEALDRLHTTAASHHRVMILEVMGRNAGWIALHAGVAGGADIILIPEIPFQLEFIFQKVKARLNEGKRFSLMMVAEGAYEKGGSPVIKRKDKKNPYPIKLGGIGKRLEEKIERLADVETRAAVLGHIQRGGSPVPVDRNLGTLFGKEAVHLIRQNQFGRMVCLSGQEIKSIPLEKAIRSLKIVPRHHPLIQAARSVGTSFGDR
ncbi:MAG: ATP-dependent 6-phosphofructokinase [Candidatus Omnitrophica bacterium]|nr:ATP-dependent 6-phosphofructokinase [Candidatus Omnitrophota bacterium]